MKNKADYSKYECPYSHLEKESGHELTGPEGHQDVYGVWCACGFRGPVFYLDPDELGLKLKNNTKVKITDVVDGKADSPLPIEVRHQGDNVFKTYEEVELACLRKLIEIVKQKK